MIIDEPITQLVEELKGIRQQVEKLDRPELYRVLDRITGAQAELHFLIGMERARG